ncbi:MAG: hypothetical protein WCZ98_08465 [Sideroxydans sp.]
MKIQQGFSIITAIFLLVVLAFLGVAMVTFSTTQHQTVAMDVMGSRAYQAARAGVDWGAYQVLRNGSCAATTTLPAMAGTLSQFGVSVTCGSVAASEVTATSGTVTVYSLSSTATFGTLGQPSYVERQIQITIAQ